MDKIEIKLSKEIKNKPDLEGENGFGNIYSDHMLIMDYDDSHGWHNQRIIPYSNIT